MSAASTDDAPRAPRHASRADVIATLAIVGTFVAIIAARPLARRVAPHPSREQCAAMLTRYDEHKARAAILDPKAAASALPPRPTPPADDIDRCVHDLTRSEIDCALAANNADEVERCLPQD